MTVWPRYSLAKKPAPSHPLKVFWWRYDYPKKLNFGDEVTPEIIEKLWGISCEWASIQTCDLIATGSILNMTIRDNTRGHAIDVWGSGFIARERRVKKLLPTPKNDLVFHAVRGRLSRRRLGFRHRCIALGDPGILVNRVYPRSRRVTHKLGVVTHFVDMNNQGIRAFCGHNNIKLISPLQSPGKVVRDITSCEAIASSSLHGLIFADSFGIPNIHLQISDEVIGGDYKFRDYYSAMQRPFRSAALADIASGAGLERAIVGYQPIVDLEQLQQDLMQAFPYLPQAR